ncbi:hypothetical protein FS837_000405, partial [Tulasnella sp. UAMH 9824]
MTQQLPNELKIQIIQHVDKKYMPVVLRVNSTFHEIGVPILYHTIVLNPFPFGSQLLGTATACLSTIIERPAAARAVHSMGVDLFDWSPYTHHSESDVGANKFFEAFRTALPKVVNLQKLEISNWGNTDIAPVAQFPRGCQFSTLKHYEGPPEMLDNIQSSVLRTLFIRSIEGNISTISSALLAAAQLSGHTLRALRVRCEVVEDDSESEEWDGLYRDIPSLFPNLRNLALESGH